MGRLIYENVTLVNDVDVKKDCNKNITDDVKTCNNDNIGLRLAYSCFLMIFPFLTFLLIFMNTQKSKQDYLHIWSWQEGLCLSLNLVSILVVYDK